VAKQGVITVSLAKAASVLQTDHWGKAGKLDELPAGPSVEK